MINFVLCLQNIPENRKWEFPRHQLRFLCLLDEGCFGQVWKCEALNITRDAEEGAAGVVAVKTLKGTVRISKTFIVLHTCNASHIENVSIYKKQLKIFHCWCFLTKCLFF